jgi:hypothetical protein
LKPLLRDPCIFLAKGNDVLDFSIAEERDSWLDGSDA